MIYYKYSSFENGVKSIADKKIKVTPPDELNDAYEALMLLEDITFDQVKESFLSGKIKTPETEYIKAGILSYPGGIENPLAKAYLDTSLLKLQRTIKDTFIHTFDEYRKKSIAVFSMTTDPLSRLMWAHYGDCYRGLCIGYDFKDSNYEEMIHHVDYPDARLKLTFEDIHNEDKLPKLVKQLLTSKSPDWSYEHEHRIIMPLTQDDMDSEFILKPVLPSQIKEIIVTPKCNYVDFLKLYRILKSDEYKHINVYGAHFSDDKTYDLKKTILQEGEMTSYFHGAKKFITHSFDENYRHSLESN